MLRVGERELDLGDAVHQLRIRHVNDRTLDRTLARRQRRHALRDHMIHALKLADPRARRVELLRQLVEPILGAGELRAVADHGELHVALGPRLLLVVELLGELGRAIALAPELVLEIRDSMGEALGPDVRVAGAGTAFLQARVARDNFGLELDEPRRHRVGRLRPRLDVARLGALPRAKLLELGGDEREAGPRLGERKAVLDGVGALEVGRREKRPRRSMRDLNDGELVERDRRARCRRR